MKVGFFVQGSGIHWDLAKHLIASCKKLNLSVFQLTDDKTPECEGVDGVVRLGGTVPMAIRRMTLQSMLAGEWLFVDTDVVLQKDPSQVFRSPFDIALTDRVGSLWEHSPGVKNMPFNTGVVFSRQPSFFKRVVGALKGLPPPLQEWYGDQLVICEMQKQNQVSARILPGQVYNFTPANRDDDRSHAAIIHYKGPRKAWIED